VQKVGKALHYRSDSREDWQQGVIKQRASAEEARDRHSGSRGPSLREGSELFNVHFSGELGADKVIELNIMSYNGTGGGAWIVPMEEDGYRERHSAPS
jgi:hypothetical protein